MRPCNQCRKPIENGALLCEECLTWNKDNGEESKTSESERDPRLAAPDGDFYADHSYAILMGIFSLVITLLFALIGLAVNDINGLVIGGSVGLVIGALTFTVMIRM